MSDDQEDETARDQRRMIITGGSQVNLAAAVASLVAAGGIDGVDIMVGNNHGFFDRLEGGPSRSDRDDIIEIMMGGPSLDERRYRAIREPVPEVRAEAYRPGRKNPRDGGQKYAHGAYKGSKAAKKASRKRVKKRR